MDTTLLGSVADWALVIITLTYAIFTIGIFLSNRKANELTKKQLEDIKAKKAITDINKIISEDSTENLGTNEN